MEDQSASPPQRDSMAYDVVIVGGGPSGLSAAIRLKQLAADKGQELSVCILEKGSEIGAHLVSGAVFEPRALDELIPDWKEKGAPLNTPAKQDQFLYLTEKKAFKLPTPAQMKNHGNYIISLGELARWLAEQATGLGVEIYPGFAAADVLYHDDGSVKGVATGDMGIQKDGTRGPNYAPGVELHARQTIFAEGCRGSLTKQLEQKFDLRRECDPQTYGIGIKEIWEIPKEKHQPGLIVHTVGWPMDRKTYGGSFIYHWGENLVSIGFVIGLDYKNPHLSPYDEMQRHKLHPAVRKYLDGGRRVSYGARALVEGGFQSLPKLSFPGGVLVGDCAGFLNTPKIKGNHTAMKSGMVAAEVVFDHLRSGEGSKIDDYRRRLNKTWLMDELHKARNIRPGFHKGLWWGLVLAAVDTYIFRGAAPWTFKNHSDYDTLQHADKMPKIDYPRPDGVLTFDKMSSVQLSNTFHEENQPAHLKLTDASVPVQSNLPLYDEPAQRYCPAGVYEIVEEGGQKKFVINAQNCVHCKTCDIKDPAQNITWTVPEGGGGPNYANM